MSGQRIKTDKWRKRVFKQGVTDLPSRWIKKT